MKYSKKMMALALAGVMTFSIAGCGSSGSKTTGSGDSGSGEIKIGANYELSGPVSTYGTSSLNAVKLAFEEINAKGGVLGKKLVLVERDNKSDTTEATNVATALASDSSIVALYGPVTSSNVMAASQPAIDNKIPLLTPTATSADVTVDPKTGKVKEYIFRSCFIDSFQGKVTAQFAANDLKAKKAAVLVDNGSDYSKGLAKVFNDTFTKAGGKVVDTEGFIATDNDYRALITKIKGQNPDVVFLPAYYQAVAKIVKQARELGLNVPFIGTDGWDSPKLTEVAGAGALNNTFFSNHYNADDPDPKVQDFVKKYKQKYNQTPDALAALSYDGAYMLAEAIKNAGEATPDKIATALTNIKDFKGITGTVTLDKNHDPIKSAVIIEMKNGKQTVKTRVNP